jgi:hypothetical protein
MESRVDKLRRDSRRLLRFLLVGSLLGASVAYPLLIAAKLTGNLPDHLTWAHVLLGPLVGYGLLVVMSWLASRLDLQKAKKEEQRA